MTRGGTGKFEGGGAWLTSFLGMSLFSGTYAIQRV